MVKESQLPGMAAAALPALNNTVEMSKRIYRSEEAYE